MFYSSTKHIFISHAWKYNDDYNTIVSWLNEANITWKNYSVPEHDPLDANNTQKLKGALTEQIRHANIIIIIGDMYANYSNWIEYEVDEAKRMYKKNYIDWTMGTTTNSTIHSKCCFYHD